eukprot:GDKI01034412.1.p1 GENE.GDKI01034412.1~~GDKI01034412.1.p1  ORF type:complete len:466 (+),score=127.83 GDKI01034412.1:76-1473(+)
MRYTSLGLFFLLCVHAATGTGANKQHDAKVDKIEMMRHSFEAPLTYDNTLIDWELGGASIPAHRHVVLMPQVANRTGQLWHKEPLKTANFEIEIEFSVKGPDFSKSEGFAFWYVYENFTSIYPKTDAERKAWSLFGYKNNFQGVGVFFSNFDKTKKLSPSISAAYNDGSKAMQLFTDVPTQDQLTFNFRNSKDNLKFRIAAGPKGVLGQLQYSANAPWIDVFRLNTKLRPGGFIGLTGYTGPEEGAPEKQGDFVSVSAIRSYNLDLNSAGEDSEVAHELLGDEEFGDLLKEHSHFKSQHEQVAALKTLTRMLYKHISEAAPREQTIYKTLNTLQNQVHKLISDVKELATEIKMASNASTGDSLHHMKNELLGLRTMISRHSQQQSQTLSSLHKTVSTIHENAGADESPHVKEVRQLAQRTASLEDTIKSNATYSSWLIFAVLCTVAGFAFSMWKRMRDMEKKHFL